MTFDVCLPEFVYELESQQISYRPSSGFVYIMKGEDKVSKIGKTINSPSKRLHEINRFIWKNVSLEYVKEVVDVNLYERALHKLFKKYRLKGEWFNLSPEEIKNVSEMGPVNFRWERYLNENDWKYKQAEDRIAKERKEFEMWEKEQYPSIR